MSGLVGRADLLACVFMLAAFRVADRYQTGLQRRFFKDFGGGLLIRLFQNFFEIIRSLDGMKMTVKKC